MGALANTSQDSESERPTKEATRKHCIYTHFPKDRNCEICKRTKSTRALCKENTGEAIRRAEKFGDLIAADHTVLTTDNRIAQFGAVVVHDLATQWIQSYPCKTQTSRETERSLRKFLELSGKTKVIFTDSSLEFGKSCEDLSWNHCTSTNALSIRDEWCC